tara:strand:- start:248 stop:499 length:252 start_codon:yes stop_codon:yes gene_type:complete
MSYTATLTVPIELLPIISIEELIKNLGMKTMMVTDILITMVTDAGEETKQTKMFTLIKIMTILKTAPINTTGQMIYMITNQLS